MKFLSVLFFDDGTFCGVQGNERPLRDSWTPPPYLLAGDVSPRQTIAVHLGAAEMPVGGCCCDDLFRALGPHPDSTPAAPRFAIRDRDLMPQIHDVPVMESEMPGWLRRWGTKRLPFFYRAWMTLTMPDLAKQFGLHRGVTLEDMLAIEAKRNVRPEHSRVHDLHREIVDRDERASAAQRKRLRNAVQEKRLRALHSSLGETQ